MKKLIPLFLAGMMALSLCACGGTDTAPAENTDGKATEEQTEATEAAEPTVYGIGDTWTVDGQWSFTITGVTPTDDRNEFSDTFPAQVVVISYEYENLGYEDPDGLWDGLYMDVENAQVVDSGNAMAYLYPAPGSLEPKYPQETPVGAHCTAEGVIGLDNAGNSIKVYMTQYDSEGNKQKAEFVLDY